ncbi:hypothetical protein D1013_04615 [Euzebyella marina]|uniref:Uncharacterized protein n=1 Tax=Euzebyella marina TaxID=1761453 RepID=A0A3G2L3D5_9FLAO|nr:hypothetical protein [Euzebyella marina]AYN66711.1 hypothetical protein D1013_04615 [Euzebyella marina]
MMKYVVLIPMFLLAFCSSDDDSVDNCLAADCIANFTHLYIKLIQETSDKNVLSDDIYSLDDISISSDIAYSLETQSVLEEEVLAITQKEWGLANYDLTLKVGENEPAQIRFTLAKTGKMGCCSNLLYIEALYLNDTLLSTGEYYPILTVMVK